MGSIDKIRLTGKAHRGQMFQGAVVASRHAYCSQSRLGSGTVAASCQRPAIEAGEDSYQVIICQVEILGASFGIYGHSLSLCIANIRRGEL
jgi:hypothetical protein